MPGVAVPAPNKPRAAIIYRMQYFLDAENPIYERRHILSVGFGVNSEFPILMSIQCLNGTKDELIFTEQDWSSLTAVNVEHRFKDFFFRNNNNTSFPEKAEYQLIQGHLELANDITLSFMLENCAPLVSIRKGREGELLLSGFEFQKIFFLNPLINHHARRLSYLNFEDFYQTCIATIADVLKIELTYTQRLLTSEAILFKGEMLSSYSILSDTPSYAQNYFCLLELLKLYPNKFIRDVQSLYEGSEISLETYV